MKFATCGVPTAEAHLDEAHAVLDETTGQQAALAEGFFAIGFAQIFRLLGEIEGHKVLALHERTASSYMSA
jgi:hypothetical protein